MNFLILVRFGEIWTKGKNRNEFIKVLANNLRQVSKNVKILRNRILVEGELERVYKIPGVESASEGVIVDRDLNSIKKEAKKLLDNSKTFSIRAKRIDKNFKYHSMELNKIIGEYLSKFSKVNLKNPEKTIGIEIFEDFAFMFDKTIRGPGGLPVGTNGKCISLVSSGIDSPVSTWMMMRRGCEPIIVHYDIANSKVSFEKILKKLKEFHPNLKYYILPYGKILSNYKLETRSWCLICKRLMIRIAQRIAEEEGAKAIIMGDSLGQVASQTIDNIKIIERVAELPIFRPLIGLNKNEIINYAKRIGTFELAEDFKCPMVPKKPITKGKLKLVEKLESKLPIEKIINEILSHSM